MKYTKPRTPRHFAGFTLVEMMMVILIVAVLAVLSVMAITAFDQLHPEVSDPLLKRDTPEGLAHGRYRLGIYFDSSVGKFNKDNQPF